MPIFTDGRYLQIYKNKNRKYRNVIQENKLINIRMLICFIIGWKPIEIIKYSLQWKSLFALYSA